VNFTHIAMVSMAFVPLSELDQQEANDHLSNTQMPYGQMVYGLSSYADALDGQEVDGLSSYADALDGQEVDGLSNAHPPDGTFLADGYLILPDGLFLVDGHLILPDGLSLVDGHLNLPDRLLVDCDLSNAHTPTKTILVGSHWSSAHIIDDNQVICHKCSTRPTRNGNSILPHTDITTYVSVAPLTSMASYASRSTKGNIFSKGIGFVVSICDFSSTATELVDLLRLLTQFYLQIILTISDVISCHYSNTISITEKCHLIK
jgi:hypothetical protein